MRERGRDRVEEQKERVRGRRVDDFTTCRLISYTGSLSAVLCLCGSGRFDISGAFNSGTGNRWRWEMRLIYAAIQSGSSPFSVTLSQEHISVSAPSLSLSSSLSAPLSLFLSLLLTFYTSLYLSFFVPAHSLPLYLTLFISTSIPAPLSLPLPISFLASLSGAAY